jgi:hypothetical protein
VVQAESKIPGKLALVCLVVAAVCFPPLALIFLIIDALGPGSPPKKGDDFMDPRLVELHLPQLG